MEYYKTDINYKLNPQLPDEQQLNLNDVNSSNTNGSSHGELFQNFDKIDMKEIEPTIQNINECIFEEDLSIVIDELVNLNFKDLNKGIEENVRKQHILDCINNYKIKLQEIYNWLLNNQINSNSIYLFGYFNYHGFGTNVNKQIAFNLIQKAADLENNVAQLDIVRMYIDGKDVGKDYDI